MKYLFVLASIILAFSLNAKPLNLAKVSESSNWIMHMDFESMRSSEIGVFLEDSLEKVPEMDEKRKDLQKKFGVDLMGVSNLTFFGSGEKHKGIGILEGGVDASIVTEVTRSREYIQESKVGKKTIFSTDKGRRSMAFSVLKKGKIVFGPDRDYVSEGIQLANGKGSGSSGHPILESLNELLDNPCLVFFANMKGAKEVAELNQWASLMTDKIDSCGMVVGGQDGGLTIIGLIETNSIESSEPMENMIHGGLAMMDMKVKKDERMKEFLEGYKVTREGKIIRVEIELSNSLIIDRIQKEMKKAV
ncbi:MAG: hypothetical protein HN754_03790 [Opitutae bacterium]|nr:hypothetical protein [Opitutae bacterium]